MEDIEPTRFAWVRDGLLVTGTLTDWAKMWEGDYYAGENDLTTALLTWSGGEADIPVIHRVTVERWAPTENDYIPYAFSVPGLPDRVSVSIDGRA